MVREVARSFSAAFAPEYFVLVCTVLLVVYEWRVSDRGWPALGPRFGVVAVAWGLAFAVYELGPAALPAMPTAPDLFGGLGLALGFVLIWAAWRSRGWGRGVVGLAEVLVALTLLHSVIVPVWNLSSHVAYTAAPAVYATVVDRRFAPLLVVPLGMVASRPLAGAHTWLQSVAGFVLGGAILLAVLHYRRADDARGRPEMERA